jgi:hypothetical protein
MIFTWLCGGTGVFSWAFFTGSEGTLAYNYRRKRYIWVLDYLAPGVSDAVSISHV